MDNIKTGTRLSAEESIRMTEDRDEWRKCVHGVDRGRLKQKRREKKRRELWDEQVQYLSGLRQ